MKSNVSLLRNLIDYVSAEGIACAILSLDWEKEFDRSFPQKTLTSMDFGPSFCRWVSIFYTIIESIVIVNGHISAFFSLSLSLSLSLILSRSLTGLPLPPSSTSSLRTSVE